MPIFTQALAAEGARVIGVGDQPADALPEMARRSLSRYVQISSFADEDAAVDETIAALRGTNVDLVESMWEATMYLAARLRERIGTPGLDVAHTVPFRDKQVMKEVLGAAGIRVPRSVRASTIDAVRAGADEVGYPLIIKPIAGAGSMDTYRIDEPAGLDPVLPRLRGVPEVSVEEFIDAEEYTFDTISAGGRIEYYNVCWYRPRPLAMKQLEWVSPQVFSLREPDAGAAGRRGGDGPCRARRHGPRCRLRAHGVVPDRRRRGGLRRDRCARRRRPPRRRHELRQRRRRVPGLGRGGGPRPVQPGGRPQVQRRPDLQAGAGSGADPAHRGAVPVSWPRSASTSSSSTCSPSGRHGGTGPTR